MANKKLQALERLTGKLTALRKTLRGEERALLDKMVLSLSAEVTPHSAKVDSKQTGKQAGKQAGKQMRTNADANEVAVHGLYMEPNADGKTAGKQMRSTPGSKTSGKQLKVNAAANAQEVQLHSINVDDYGPGGKTAGKQMRSVPASKTSGKQLRVNAAAADNEVELHGLKIDRQNVDGKQAGKQAGATAGAVARINVNERQGVYQITVD